MTKHLNAMFACSQDDFVGFFSPSVYLPWEQSLLRSSSIRPDLGKIEATLLAGYLLWRCSFQEIIPVRHECHSSRSHGTTPCPLAFLDKNCEMACRRNFFGQITAFRSFSIETGFPFIPSIKESNGEGKRRFFDGRNGSVNSKRAYVLPPPRHPSICHFSLEKLQITTVWPGVHTKTPRWGLTNCKCPTRGQHQNCIFQ